MSITDLSPAAIQWLATGARDMPSESLFTFGTGVLLFYKHFGIAYPKDVSDLRLSMLLIEQCPEIKDTAFAKASASCPEWAELILRWDQLTEQMEAEWPDWRKGTAGRTPQTRAIMYGAIQSVKSK